MTLNDVLAFLVFLVLAFIAMQGPPGRLDDDPRWFSVAAWMFALFTLAGAVCVLARGWAPVLEMPR